MSNNKHKIQLTPEEKKARLKNRKINNNLVLLTLLLSVLVIAFFVFNIGTIGLKKTNNSTGDTLQLDEKNKLTNDQYIIGNNPTDIQKEYFKELTESLDDTSNEGRLATAQAVTKCFIADYYTWTNKDGNYEVGGVQYVFGPKYIMFQEQSRYQFYNDLDLYISQYGRENLLEVTNVEITKADYTNNYVVNGIGEYEAFYIEANWEYKKSSKIDVSEFQNKAYFIVANNNGRLEIASIGQMDW